MLRDFFLGFIRVHIVYHASEGPVSGAGIMEEPARHGYELSPGTLYPILHELKEQGYIRASNEVVEGKVRSYCQTTSAGAAASEATKPEIAELVEEVLGRT
jgi:DNA-binding PadR family transcriptional regulator